MTGARQFQVGPLIWARFRFLPLSTQTTAIGGGLHVAADYLEQQTTLWDR